MPRTIMLVSYCLSVLFISWGGPVFSGVGKETSLKSSGNVAGIVLDKKDNWLQMKLDGQEEAVKFTFDSADKKLNKSMSEIFSVARVKLAYKTKDEVRQIVSIEKAGTTGQGVVTGVILDTHKWWVELKPNNGPPEGYAATYPAEVWKKIEEAIKELKKGDPVQIQYYTDGERHRIMSMVRAPK